MKTKNQKLVLLKDNTKDILKQQIKNVAKVISPKSTLSKGLTSYRSQKDLGRMLEILDSKPNNNLEVSIDSSIAQCSNTSSKASIKTAKDGQSKFEIKTINSPKNTLHLSPKQQVTKFFRAKTNQIQKEEQKTRKIAQEKYQKVEELEKKNQQLQIKIQILRKQKQKIQQIVQQYKSQKQALQKNVQKLKFVSLENKKLLKQRVQGYNNHGSELKNLRDQLQQLKQSKKRTDLLDNGTNTQEQWIIKSKQEEKNGQNTCEQKAPIVSQVQIKQIQNTEVHLNFQKYLQELSNINTAGDTKLQLLKNLYQLALGCQSRKINQHEQTIYQQQKQLNELYQKLQQKQTHRIPVSLTTDQSLLLAMHYNHQLKNIIDQQDCKINGLREELGNRESDISNLQRQLMIKDIYHRNEIESGSLQVADHTAQLEQIKKQLEEALARQKQHQSKIRDLENKNSAQDLIIKTLKQKKKVIVK